MKKLLFPTVVCLLASFILGCKKENVTNEAINPATNELTCTKPELANDMLIFSTWDDFATTVQYLNQKGSAYIIKWNDDLNFRSQEAIFQDIINAENAIIDAKAAELDPNLSFEEMRKVQVPHSEIYKQYLGQGIIIEVPESDGSTSFKHNALNPTFMCALNEDGFVQIHDTIYQYLSNRVKFISDGDVNKIERLKKLTKTSLNENMHVVEYQNNLKSMTGGDWGNTTGWVYNGATKRIRVDVVAYCPSSSEYQTYAFVNFYFEAMAQGWFGIWNYRNDYNPIDLTQGSWNWTENYLLIEDPFSEDYDSYSGSHYYDNFPMSGYTNYCKFYLNPNGWVGKPDYYLFSFMMYYSFSVTANVYGTLTVTP